MSNVRTTAVVAVLVSAVAGCGGGGSGGIGPSQPPPVDETTPEISVTDVYTGLTFLDPTVLKQAPGDNTRWFVGEKRGVIRVFDNDPSVSAASVFLDISALVSGGGEGGLLGIAFDPNYPIVPEVYVSYTRPGPDAATPLISYVSRFTSADLGLTALPDTEDVILAVLQPESNHNGGDIAFGPDGFLYVAFGDGGGSGDPLNYGQDDTNLHGTIVRLDVDSSGAYDIPPGNPNAGNGLCTQGFGSAPCPEIFAWGLRNPWRMSFDRATGNLWAADVGQSSWEEVNVIESGKNYGWSVREGAHCFNAASCATTFTDPVTEYDRSLGVSVTGGYVYRGTAIADLEGWYVFGDFGSGRLFGVPEDSLAGAEPEVLLDTPNSIVTFGQDDAGELYFMDYSLGTIHKIENAP